MMYILIPASKRVSVKGEVRCSTNKHPVESVICKNAVSAAIMAHTTEERIKAAYEEGKPVNGWFVDRWDSSWEG